MLTMNQRSLVEFYEATLQAAYDAADWGGNEMEIELKCRSIAAEALAVAAGGNVRAEYILLRRAVRRWMSLGNSSLRGFAWDCYHGPERDYVVQRAVRKRPWLWAVHDGHDEPWF